MRLVGEVQVAEVEVGSPVGRDRGRPRAQERERAPGHGRGRGLVVGGEFGPAGDLGQRRGPDADGGAAGRRADPEPQPPGARLIAHLEEHLVPAGVECDADVVLVGPERAPTVRRVHEAAVEPHLERFVGAEAQGDWASAFREQVGDQVGERLVGGTAEGVQVDPAARGVGHRLGAPDDVEPLAREHVRRVERPLLGRVRLVEARAALVVEGTDQEDALTTPRAASSARAASFQPSTEACNER